MAPQVRNVDEINARLSELSGMIYPAGLTLVYVEVALVRDQDINARTMPKKMLDQLIENIKGAGTLESVPLLVKTDGLYSIISGHHRIRAARAAGISHVLCLTYENLTHSRVRSKQLAHNTIEGKDDPEVLKRIWDQITEVQAQFEAFVDRRVFSAIPEPVSFRPVDIDLESRAKAMLLVFMGVQKQDYDAAVEAIMPKAKVDAAYLAHRSDYDAWASALRRTRDELEISNVPTAVAEMARLAMQRLDQLNAEREAQQVAE